MRRFTLAMAAVVLAVTAGCSSVGVDTETTKREPVAHDHACIDACDHIYAEGGWRLVKGHRHGPNCGHALVNGRWVEDKAAGQTDVPEKSKKTDR